MLKKMWQSELSEKWERRFVLFSRMRSLDLILRWYTNLGLVYKHACA